MKKLAIILALLMVPAFAFGMDTISDSDLESVTGQAGVSIALTSIMIQKSSGTTSYGDNDGTNVQWVSIVAEGTSTKMIGFHSVGGRFDALTIDIVNLSNVDGHNLHTVVVASDGPLYTESAIKISLPDIIQIEETAALQKVIYMSDGAVPVQGVNADELIRIYSTAGTTRIIGADMGVSFTEKTNATDGAGYIAASYASGLNTTIIITAHD